MKTATIRVNHIFGTKNAYCADVFYRGKLLATFDRRVVLDWESQAAALANYAKGFAVSKGFTHYKIIFG
jgi:hypothetical protein